MQSRLQTQLITGKINHLIYMGIKPFAKNEKDLGTLIQTIRIYSQYIGIKFSIEKCAIPVKKSGKGHMTEGKSSSYENARGKGNLQILGDIGRWHH